MSGFSIGGIASGLDTSSIIQQLMQLERQPLQVMANRQAAWRKTDAAWGQVTTKLSSVRNAVDALKDPTALSGAVSAKSSNDAVATVKVTGKPNVGVTDLKVEALAAAHRASVGGSFASATDAVGAGVITVNGEGGTALGTVTFDETTTLEEAARQFEALDGVRAQVVNTGADGYKLVLTAEETGAAGTFSVEAPAGHALGSETVLSQGTDARLSMGSLVITRSSNTVTDLFGGVELNLKTTGDMSIVVEQDVDASAKLVTDLVNAVNGALTEMKKHGNTSATAGERGALAGDATLRTLTNQLRGVVAGLDLGTEYGVPSSVGISLTRDGALTLDEAKLREAIRNDPSAVAALVGRASSADDAGIEITGTGRATAGGYSLHLDDAATVAQVTGAAYAPPTVDPTVFTITGPSGQAVEISLTAAEDSVTSAVSAINTALRAAGETSITASDDGGAIRLVSSRAGTAGNFTVAGSGALGLDAVVAGQGASGTLTGPDGVAHPVSSSGRTLAGPAGTTAAGLVFNVPLGASGDLGAITVADGLAGAFDRVLRTAEGSTGTIAGARQNLENRIKATDDSIAASERRLELRETTLRRQFTAMEQALATLQSQGNWLAGQLGGMNG